MMSQGGYQLEDLVSLLRSGARRWVLALVLACPAFNANAEPAERLILHSREIPFTETQQKSIDADQPFVTALFGDSTLWLVGARSVWQYHLIKNTLIRIDLLKAQSTDRLQIGTRVGNSLWVASQSTAFQIQFKPLSINHYAFPLVAKKSIGLHSAGATMDWVTDAGIARIFLDKSMIELIFRGTDLSPYDRSIQVSQIPSYWLLHNDQIVEIATPAKGTQKPKEILRTHMKIMGMQKLGDEIFIHTKYTVLRMDPAGNILQTIPVLKERRLVALTGDDRQHTYLFSDRLLQKFDLTKQDSTVFHVPLQGARRAQMMALNKTFLALVLDGKPHLYQLPGQP